MIAWWMGAAWAGPLVLTVLPDGGPWFERIQSRTAGDPTAQLQFEVDILEVFDAVVVDRASFVRLEDGAPVGDPLVLEREELREYLGGAERFDVTPWHGRDGFGTDDAGTLTTDVSGSSFEMLLDVAAVQDLPVGAGYATVQVGLSSQKRFLVAAYDHDGAPTALLPVDFGTSYEGSLGTSVVASAAGDAVLAGGANPTTLLNSGREQFAVVRTTSAGVPDPLFSSDGKLTTGFGSSCDARAEDIEELGTLGPDDSTVLIAIGWACSPRKIALAAYDADGNAWGAFTGVSNAGPGTVLFAPVVAIGEKIEVGGGAVDDANDKVYVVGRIGNDLMVARFDGLGKIDPTYGVAGVGRFSSASWVPMKGYDAQVLADGRLVVAAEGISTTSPKPHAMLTAMVSADGKHLDGYFGGSGLVASTFSGFTDSLGRDVDVDEATKRVTTMGTAIRGTDQRFAVASFSLDGFPDVAFDGEGQRTLQIGTTANLGGGDLDDNGYLVIAGFSGANLAAARIWPVDGALDDPTVWSADTRQLLRWPDPWYDVDDLPDAVRIEADLSDPLTGADAGTWVEDWAATEYESPIAFSFPADREDLGEGERWRVDNAHELDQGHRLKTDYNTEVDRFDHGQRYAYDLAVARWDGDLWTSVKAGEDGDENDEHLVWGKPVHPMAEGDIVYCTNGVQQNSKPDVKDGATQCAVPNWDSNNDGVKDACFWKGGGNTVTILHDDGTYTFYGHMQQLLPEICLQGVGSAAVGPIPVGPETVLGIVGNSGNSTGPHVHVSHDSRVPDIDESDSWPLYWGDVVGIHPSDGPEAFPFPLVPEVEAQHDGSILEVSVGLPEPKPETDCAPALSYDEQDEAYHPDGDYGIGWYCPDADGESVCVQAWQDGWTYGHCEPCAANTDKPVGCTCASDEQCSAGNSCWGSDLHAPEGASGTSTGLCYPATDGPPSWQCPMVCSELYGESEAWCDHAYELGVAKCFDGGTDSLIAGSCFYDGADPDTHDDDGMFAMNGGCVLECTSDDDCGALGYPPAYHCHNDDGVPMCLHESLWP